uniref:ADP ribosylation factor n=1 Tax=Pristionchus pacificus TaxID=54126 RepID=A0A2A6CCC4_PRIPA|eukprot:PDM75834.1 ADP ribosylation factor [Pristionchus pacificus]
MSTPSTRSHSSASYRSTDRRSSSDSDSGYSSVSRTVKVILVGESCAGKSAIMQRFMGEDFNEETKTTIGIDFFHKTITTKGGEDVTLQVWDTAGQERFTQLMPSYIRHASIAILRGDFIKLVLVGNKSDLDLERKIVPKMVYSFLGEDIEVPYIETSARTGENIDELFDNVANIPVVPQQYPLRPERRSICLSISGEKHERKCLSC